MGSKYIKISKWIGIIIIVRLLSLLFLYPCYFDYDASVGMIMFLSPADYCVACDHHPVFVQAVHSLFFLLGDGIGGLFGNGIGGLFGSSMGGLLGDMAGRSIGMFLLTMIHMLFFTAIVAYGLRLLQLTGVSRFWQKVVAMLYAFFPVFILVSLYPTKDGFFCNAILLYALTTYEMFLTRGENLKRLRLPLLHAFAALLMCLTRHQGLYFVVLETVILLIVYRRYWLQLVVFVAPVVVGFVVYSKVLLPWYGVEPSGKQELYQVMFQQTANCLRTYPDDITVEERAAISRILDIDTIIKVYNPKSADPVKAKYRYVNFRRNPVTDKPYFFKVDRIGEDEALAAYRNAWLSMGLRHPLVYVEATANIVGSYFWRFDRALMADYECWAKATGADSLGLAFSHVELYENFSRKMEKHIIWSYTIKAKCMKIVYCIPVYMWISVILLLLFIIKRPGMARLVVFLPMTLSLLLCLITPMVFGRYTYPVLFFVPLLLSQISLRKKIVYQHVKDCCTDTML